MKDLDKISKQLDELINVSRVSTMPIEHRWLDKDEAGSIFGCCGSHFSQRIACLPGFPTPLRIGGIGNPRWKASEILSWADKERDKVSSATTGRPRKTA